MSVYGPPRLYFEPVMLQNFDFNADPYPDFHSNADPEPAFKSNADPDPQPCLEQRRLSTWSPSSVLSEVTLVEAWI
jgi:hypothetical protein